MASLNDYGGLLLASRLRKLSEALYGGVDTIYRQHGVDLSSRCFPILFLLRDHGRLGISELAQQLGQSHPAVSQMSRKLQHDGLVREWADRNDERRRLLGLTPRATALMRRLVPVWQAITTAVDVLEARRPIGTALMEFDQALAQRDFAARIEAQLQFAQAGARRVTAATRRVTADAVEIIAFEPRYRNAFKRLNLEWLEKYFRVEPIDVRVLSRPQDILAGGGHILLARLGKRVLGTCALLRSGDRHYELSKMSVTSSQQGLGIGRRLMLAAIRTFEDNGGRQLFLETNSMLAPAIKLYESVGFVSLPRPPMPSHYERSNVYMEYRKAP
jgi:DNA-binding MarR family transcriptional regulator/GNAT superfamily N-acetyltransferase